ncbi:DUF6516 family protein [Desulfococcaceae bacterium HSG8]|nr:DUF6516 family protein [Desulfococcaceae bacterium HSG8]
MTEGYFQEIVAFLGSRTWAVSAELIRHNVLETDEEKILVYRIKITLPGGGLLEMRERIVESEEHCKTTTYSFRWQNRDRTLVKRWDNAPHHPELDNFPHYIHADDESDVIPGESVNALEVLAEVDRYFRQH